MGAMADTARTAHRGRIGIAIAAFIVTALLVVPLVWPVPPLEDTLPPTSLAGPDSLFIEIDGVSVHYEAWGIPPASDSIDTAFVLLHGFGASTFSWREVAGPLSERMPVVAFDRPAFGLTERPLSWTGANPYSPETQAELTVKLMDELGIDRAVLVGHSAGGTVAALTAARYPGRVAAVVLEDPAIFAGGPPSFLTPLFRTPQLMRIGPLLVRRLAGPAGDEFIRTAWHDPASIPAETFAGYRTPLQAEDWDTALWLLTVAPRPDDVPGTVGTIGVPALFMTGDDDRIVPPEDTERAAALVSGAELVTIRQCGHIPHEEQPEDFIDAVGEFLDREAIP